eukprot:Sdes_comp15743_c0_seq2m4784
MEIIKRPLSPSSHQNTSKKPKNEVAVAQNVGKSIVASTPLRTSNLPAPIMLLSGHLGEVLTTRFSPCGKYIASGGTDKQIYLWSVFDKCENFSMLTGHRGAVLELCWSEDGSKIVSASSDKTVTIFDVETGRKIRQCRGHEGIVNSCSTNKGTPHQLIVSASDDGSVRVWDARKAKQISSFQQGYPLTACCFDETSDSVFAGGVGNVIQAWDLSSSLSLYSLQAHKDSITGIRLSPDGCFLLSNAMDSIVHMWDVRPFVSSSRCVSSFPYSCHNFEKNILRCAWSADGSKASCGSSDRLVNIWDIHTGTLLYQLPGHEGAVTQVEFHPC